MRFQSRYLLTAAALIAACLLLAACGEEEEEAGAPAAATFSGPLQPGGGVSGRITLTLSVTRDEIVEVVIRGDLDNVTCPWGSVTATRSIRTHYVAIPIVEAAFTLDGQNLRLSGVFDSPTSASGTISEDIGSMGSPCYYEPVTWTATAQ